MAARKTALTLPPPLQFLSAWLAVWLGRVLQEQVDFLKEENQLLREKLGTKRIQLTDAERMRLATLGKKLGRNGLAQWRRSPRPKPSCAQGLENALSVPCTGDGSGKVVRRDRLGGVLSFYYREAA